MAHRKYEPARRPWGLRKAHRKKPGRRLQLTEDALTMTSQESLDAAVGMDVTVIIAGGTPERPLILREKLVRLPVAADGCCLALVPADLNHPPDVLVLDTGANVLLRGTARAEMRGDSVLRAKDQSKARVFSGRLVCGGDARCTLYGNSVGIAWGRARCNARNTSRVMLMEQARAVAGHSSAVYIWAESACAWRKGNAATIRRTAPGAG